MQKEHYLGLSVGNDNWWRRNGIGCREIGGAGGSGLGDSENGGGNTTKCSVSYAVSIYEPYVSGYNNV